METKTEAQHTPTPWVLQEFVDPTNGDTVFQIHNGELVISETRVKDISPREAYEEQKANAVSIVRAVNDYEANQKLIAELKKLCNRRLEENEALLEAAKDMLAAIDHYVVPVDTRSYKKAIAQAEGR